MQFGMAGVHVMLAMPTHRDIPPKTVRSLLETQFALIVQNVPCSVEMQCDGSLVHHARTKSAWEFLKSSCTHLFWVDSDIVWKAADFLRLLAFGTKLDCVSATYPCREDPPKFFIAGVEPEVEANEFGCVPVNGLGLGFTVVQRHVMEELAAKAPLRRYPSIDIPVPRIFRCDDDGTDDRGEDMAFFSDVRALGYKVWLDPSIELGHVGSKEYRARFSDHLVKA